MSQTHLSCSTDAQRHRAKCLLCCRVVKELSARPVGQSVVEKSRNDCVSLFSIWDCKGTTSAGVVSSVLPNLFFNVFGDCLTCNRLTSKGLALFCQLLSRIWECKGSNFVFRCQVKVKIYFRSLVGWPSMRLDFYVVQPADCERFAR